MSYYLPLKKGDSLVSYVEQNEIASSPAITHVERKKQEEDSKSKIQSIIPYHEQIDFFKKYLKYKNKYLELKGGSSLREEALRKEARRKEGIRKRIDSEIKKLNELSGVNNITFDEVNGILELEYNENKFKIEIPTSFPLKAIFYKNNIIIPIVWYPSMEFKNILEKENNQFKILIFCHPDIVSGTIDNIQGHFLSKDISILGREAGITGTPIIDTIDIIPGGTYQCDGFSDDFINRNLNEYNLVFIPDCGGLWLNLQLKDILDGWRTIYKFTPEDKENNLSLLIDYIIKVSKLVKINGIISFGKILVEGPCKVKGIDFNNFTEAIKYFLNDIGFETYDRPLTEYFANNIIIAKKVK